jgi:hypothetical protein
MLDKGPERELWVMGLGDRIDRGALVCSYLAEADYRARTAKLDELAENRPLGIVLDISPHSTDGWGILAQLKSFPQRKGEGRRGLPGCRFFPHADKCGSSCRKTCGDGSF